MTERTGPVRVKPSWTKAVKPLRAQGHTVNIHCPSCQHLQSASSTAVSIFCKSCQNLIRIQEVLHPQTDSEEKHPDKHPVECFRCHSINQVFIKSQAFLCKKCGYRNDMQDYTVKSVLSQNIQSKGTLTVGPNATILNSTSRVSRATIRGKYIGSLEADRIELKKDCHFDGNIIAQYLYLELPIDITIRKKFEVEHLYLDGPFYGKLVTNGIIELGENAQFYGEISAQKFIIHDTAIFLGTAEIGKQTPQCLPDKAEISHSSEQPQDAIQNMTEPISIPLNQAESIEEMCMPDSTVNPVRELRPLTVCAEACFIPPSAWKSAAFSNGVNTENQNANLSAEFSGPLNPNSDPAQLESTSFDNNQDATPVHVSKTPAKKRTQRSMPKKSASSSVPGKNKQTKNKGSKLKKNT